MPPNTNPETGIPYGVASANGFQELASDIMTNGKDLTLADWEDEVQSRIVEMLSNFVADDLVPDEESERRDTFACYWADEFQAKLDLSGRQARKLGEVMADISDVESFTYDIEEAKGEIMQWLQENDYFSNDGCDGHEYEYESGGIQYRMGTLGGAYLIWVCKSPYVTYAKHCSPCVPGACDLDNAVDENSGSLCYCFDPDDWCIEENKSDWPWKIFLVNEDGTTGECVWKHPDCEDG